MEAAAGGSGLNHELAAEVRRGLLSPAKSLACRFFYDDEGSRLFEAICALPEYYLTRAEQEILTRHAAELAALAPHEVTVFELGSGSAVKTRRVLAALLPSHAVTYVPVDISAAALEESTRALAAEFPTLKLSPIEGEYEVGLTWLGQAPGAKLLLWLGSNIGNLTRAEAVAFVARVGRAMGPEDRFVLGVDLRKDAATLEAAYDDAAGVTAAFNKNLLRRINRELGADFDLDAFRHRARYDAAAGRVDMELVSLKAQRVTLARLELEVPFAQGEVIHTESCHKYSQEELAALAAGAGLAVDRQYSDEAGRFVDVVLRKAAR